MASELREGIDLLIRRCSGLEMAIQKEPQKAQHLILHIYQCLITPPSSEALYVDELENLLDDFVMLSLNSEIDDGSIEEIADNLTILREECFQGNFASIQRLRRSQSAVPTSSNQHIQVVNGVEDDLESMEMADNLTCHQASQI